MTLKKDGSSFRP